MRQPISYIKILYIIIISRFRRHVPMSVNKTIDIFGLGSLEDIGNNALYFGTFILIFAFSIGISATFGEKAGNAKGNARVKGSVKHPVRTKSKQFLDEQITFVFRIQSVAVTDHTFFPVDEKRLLFRKNGHSHFLGEIVVHPHVVISREIVDFNAFIVQFRQFGEESEIAAWDNIFVLEPEIKDVAQKEQIVCVFHNLI